MKYQEWKKIRGLNNGEDVRNYLRMNMLKNKIPVALYICPDCNEILTGSLICKCQQVEKLNEKLDRK